MNDDQYFNDKMEEICGEQKDLIELGYKLLKRLETITDDDIKMLIKAQLYVTDRILVIFGNVIYDLEKIQRRLQQ